MVDVEHMSLNDPGDFGGGIDPQIAVPVTLAHDNRRKTAGHQYDGIPIAGW